MKKSEQLLHLKHKLDYHYKYFDFTQISPDPLEIPHRFSNDYDIEISAFISSVFAYGNVKQIINTLEKIHGIMGVSPHDFVKNYSAGKFSAGFSQIKHRFYTPDDISNFFCSLNRIYNTYGSLKYLFLLYYFEKESNLKNSISLFTRHLIEICTSGGQASHGMKFMFPDPYRGSACKRMNLFLRWMIRKDDLDFGIWPEIKPSQLVIPVDTHVARICKELKLTKQKTVSWKMAEEITENLKKIDPADPVKYDFAICHIGMRKMKF